MRVVPFNMIKIAVIVLVTYLTVSVVGIGHWLLNSSVVDGFHVNVCIAVGLEFAFVLHFALFFDLTEFFEGKSMLTLGQEGAPSLGSIHVEAIVFEGSLLNLDFLAVHTPHADPLRHRHLNPTHARTDPRLCYHLSCPSTRLPRPLILLYSQLLWQPGKLMEYLLGCQVYLLLHRVCRNLRNDKESTVIREAGGTLLFRVHGELLHLRSVEGGTLTFQILESFLQMA